MQEISPELRFDAAYKSIMQTALIAMMANGYRPDTNRSGHHMTLLQSLPKTIGLRQKRLVVLDTLRRKRNLSDYLGEEVDEGSVDKCVQEAEQLLGDVNIWLVETHPNLSTALSLRFANPNLLVVTD